MRSPVAAHTRSIYRLWNSARLDAANGGKCRVPALPLEKPGISDGILDVCKFPRQQACPNVNGRAKEEGAMKETGAVDFPTHALPTVQGETMGWASIRIIIRMISACFSL